MFKDKKKGDGFDRLQSLKFDNDLKKIHQENERHKFINQEKPQVITAFNLFQTPPHIAERMVSLCGDLASKTILEPSAGLGRILKAIPKEHRPNITAIENNTDCIKYIYNNFNTIKDLKQIDFLEYTEKTFDIILMNPPFKMGLDIKHIKHALALLNEKGLIVALCYDGVRQNKQLKPICNTWEQLPKNTFKDEGTKADVSLLTITKGD